MRRLFLLLLCAAGLSAAQAVPLQPRGDDELIETLPARRAAAASTAASPRSADPAAAVREANDWLAQAHAQGDPRFAGRALAVLQPWAADASAPAPVVLMLATTEQYIHRFDSARQRLQALVARDPRQPQAWLTLATLHRLHGRYAESDAACKALVPLPGTGLHAAACLAENQALRGDVDAARMVFQRLLAQGDGNARGWLLTSLAELEQRAGRPEEAERAFRAALAADPSDGYAALALVDLLIDRRRPAEALALLDRQPRSDAVLLRRVQAGQALTRGGSTADDARELRERFTQAALRPGAFDGHAREQALYAWHVEQDLPAAVRHARDNLGVQREPFDLLLLARAARAAGDDVALRDAVQIQKAMGLHDTRLARID